MGSDFQFTNANINFKNIDKIMTHVNDRWKNPHKYDFNSTEAQLPPINALYSTPSCYLKALNDDKRQTWPSKVDDFFPYASDPHAFWTGYFTSRYVCRFLDFHNFDVYTSIRYWITFHSLIASDMQTILNPLKDKLFQISLLIISLMIKVKAGQPNQMISFHTQLTLIPFLLVIFPLGMCG